MSRAGDIDAPWIVNVELTNACNLACVFCDHPVFAANGMRFREMDGEVLRTALAGVDGHRIHELGLVGLGEPTLDRQLESHLALIAEYAGSFERVSLNSNLVSLDASAARLLLASPVNAYTFSLNASNREAYRKLMGRDRFDRAVGNLKTFLELRRSAGGRATVSVQMFDSLENDFDAFRGLLSDWGDVELFTRKVYTKPVIREETPLLQLDKRSAAERYPCWDMYTRIYVDVDGNVYPCTIGNDCYRGGSALCVGSLREASLLDVFNGPRLAEARRAAEAGETPFPQCRDCNVWAFTPNNFSWDESLGRWLRCERPVRAYGLKQ